jgi:hypothetical protein
MGIAEVAICIVILTISMAMVAQCVVWLASERRGAERRQLAFQEAANVMEQLNTRSWESLTTDALKSISLSSAAKQGLSQAKLTVNVTPVAGDPASKKVNVEITWQSESGQPARPLRLMSWVHRRKGSQT